MCTEAYLLPSEAVTMFDTAVFKKMLYYNNGCNK